ncbi:MAG TPA: ABC transporter substrate-binding protein [Polyangiaceae bacterium]|nr:ABC transporter substrate-binding protein [Polyangiaceae bacterium]
MLRVARLLLLASLLLAFGCGRGKRDETKASSSPAERGARVAAYGEPGEPIHLSVGYQPYYSEAWSGVVMNGLGLWKKYLPAGSTVEFAIGLQGAVIVNAMLGGKEQIGYVGDMPAIVGATKRGVSDLRIVANIGLSHDQCNVFLVRTDAPSFANPEAAVRWLEGKTVAVPKGSCTDRFGVAVFKKLGITPKEYLNQSIELITSDLRVHKLDAAIVWEPTASRLVADGLARRVATGNDFGENDAAFIDVRQDLIEQRPDVVKGWLQAELDAELYLADPQKSKDVVRMVKEQTTGFEEPVLWQSLFGAYPANEGGSSTRMVVPFGFTSESLELIKRSTAFLFEVKSIGVQDLPSEAVVTRFVDAILEERGMRPPVGEIRSSSPTASK